MTSDLPRRLGVASLLLAAVALGCDRGGSPADLTRRRPVVQPTRPLTLTNPQREVVTWPVWGSAFALGEPVSVRATAQADEGLYWPTVRGEDEDYFFLPADLIVNFAEVHRQAVLGMFLVWDFELPAWLNDLAARDPEAVGATLDEHIVTLVGRYVGRVDAWVVVNEAILGADDSESGEPELTWNIWLDALGPDYIARAFVVARAADPAAVLLYNETDVELGGQKTVYADVIEACRAVDACRGVSIFGVSDRHAWDELGDATPLPFDVSYQAKPAFFAVQGALAR